MRPDTALAAEATAEEVGNDIDALWRQAKHYRHKPPGAKDVLGSVIQRHGAVGVPDSRRHGPAIRYRAVNNRGVRRACERMICRVSRRAGHFEAPIDA